MSGDLIWVCSAVLLALDIEADAYGRRRWDELRVELGDFSERWNEAVTVPEQSEVAMLAIREELFDTAARLYTAIGHLSALMTREKSQGPSDRTVMFFVSVLLIALSATQLFIFVPTATLGPVWREGAIVLGGFVLALIVLCNFVVLGYLGRRVLRYLTRLSSPNQGSS